MNYTVLRHFLHLLVCGDGSVNLFLNSQSLSCFSGLSEYGDLITRYLMMLYQCKRRSYGLFLTEGKSFYGIINDEHDSCFNAFLVFR